jgi:hypothetical protein
LNQVLWKFLADHAGAPHSLQVLLEHDMTEDMFAYQEIGDDSDGDIRVAEYLSDWPGLTLAKVD